MRDFTIERDYANSLLHSSQLASKQPKTKPMLTKISTYFFPFFRFTWKFPRISFHF